MSERDQYLILEEWFTTLTLRFTSDPLSLLFVVAFAMGDLIKMEFLTCNEKGRVWLSILEFFLSN